VIFLYFLSIKSKDLYISIVISILTYRRYALKTMDFDKKRGNEYNIDSKEERFLVDMFSQISGRLRQEYNYSDEEIYKLWNDENVLLIPAAIFAGKLSPAEALAKFLKEKHDLSYHEISGLIGRDERGVWANYKRANKKMPWPIEANGGVTVPVSIFNSDKSILEALILYLKDVKKFRNKRIAQLLNKNPANIWTVHNRAKKKENNGHKNG